ncbi:MAG: YncE family protein [Blastocatellia bacterium]
MKRLWLILGSLLAVTAISIAYANIGNSRITPSPLPFIPPEGPVLLATNQNERTVTMTEVRSGRFVVNIPVGDSPHEIAASPDGRWAVATLPGSRRFFCFLSCQKGNKVAVIDVATATLRRAIDLGEDSSPHGIAFLSDNRTVVVTSRPRQSVVLVDIEAGAVLGSISAGSNAQPRILAVSPDRQRVYSANVEGGAVSEMDLATRTLRRTIAFPGEPIVVAVAPDGLTAWVIEDDKKHVYTLAVVDLTTGAIVSRFDGFGLPRRVGISPDGAVALVTDPGRNEIRVYDVPSRKELGRVSTGEETGPSGVSFAPDSKLAYVALSGRDTFFSHSTETPDIAEIDLNTRTVVRRFKVTQTGLDGVVYVPR